MSALLGLEATLPVKFLEGKNELSISGWRESFDARDGAKKYVLRLSDGRETSPMGANAVLYALSKFEKTEPANLFKRAEGGYDYKKPVSIEFTYFPQRRFERYGLIRVFINGAKPSAPSKQEQVEAFL